jgi:hypothetical protein
VSKKGDFEQNPQKEAENKDFMPVFCLFLWRSAVLDRIWQKADLIRPFDRIFSNVFGLDTLPPPVEAGDSCSWFSDRCHGFTHGLTQSPRA